MDNNNEKSRVINRYLSRLEEIGMKLEVDPDEFLAYLERKDASEEQLKRLTEIRQQNLYQLSRRSLRK
ncbi:MAG: hypothetical protein ACR2GN_06960 [Bacteroidia bacterium]|nr:hypothetical protein [Nitrosopumilus sp.]